MGSRAGSTRKGAALRTPQDATERSAPACGPESQGLRVTLGLAVRILERTGLGRVRPEVPRAPVLRSLNEKRGRRRVASAWRGHEGPSPECS